MYQRMLEYQMLFDNIEIELQVRVVATFCV